MFFETKELYTQKLCLDDAARFHQVCTQQYILKWMDDWDMGLEQVRGLISHFIKGYEINDPEIHPYIMAIWHKADNKFIGICGFGPKDELGGKTEIAYFIDEHYSHKGYMTQIVSKAIDFFFANFDKMYLCALVDEDNFISKKVLLKHSFHYHKITDSASSIKSHYRIWRNMIDTERLIIRRFCPEDWQDLYEYLSQEEVVMYEPYEAFTQEASKQEAKERSSNDAFWAVCLKDSGKLIGNVYLFKQDYDTWELGYVFNRNYQGKGYALESVQFLVDDVFRKQNAHRVIAMCNPLNKPSWKLLERLGMRKEGHLLQNIYFKSDESNRPIWIDTFEYAILASEWITSKLHID